MRALTAIGLAAALVIGAGIGKQIAENKNIDRYLSKVPKISELSPRYTQSFPVSPDYAMGRFPPEFANSSDPCSYTIACSADLDEDRRNDMVLAGTCNGISPILTIAVKRGGMPQYEKASFVVHDNADIKIRDLKIVNLERDRVSEIVCVYEENGAEKHMVYKYDHYSQEWRPLHVGHGRPFIRDIGADGYVEVVGIHPTEGTEIFGPGATTAEGLLHELGINIALASQHLNRADTKKFVEKLSSVYNEGIVASSLGTLGIPNLTETMTSANPIANTAAVVGLLALKKMGNEVAELKREQEERRLIRSYGGNPEIHKLLHTADGPALRERYDYKSPPYPNAVIRRTGNTETGEVYFTREAQQRRQQEIWQQDFSRRQQENYERAAQDVRRGVDLAGKTAGTAVTNAQKAADDFVKSLQQPQKNKP